VQTAVGALSGVVGGLFGGLAGGVLGALTSGETPATRAGKDGVMWCPGGAVKGEWNGEDKFECSCNILKVL
jgi:hypothetical protein